MVERIDFTIHAEFTKPPADQLGVLRSEIQYQDLFLHRVWNVWRKFIIIFARYLRDEFRNQKNDIVRILLFTWMVFLTCAYAGAQERPAGERMAENGAVYYLHTVRAGRPFIRFQSGTRLPWKRSEG